MRAIELVRYCHAHGDTAATRSSVGAYLASKAEEGRLKRVELGDREVAYQAPIDRDRLIASIPWRRR